MTDWLSYFSNIRYVQCGISQGSSLGPLLFSIFTNDVPQMISQAKMIIYADVCTFYTSAPKASVFTKTLSKVFVSEWVINNKLVINTSKNKIVFGSNRS
jgi:hypothetical protein